MAVESLNTFDQFTQGYLTAAYWTADERGEFQGQDYDQTPGPKTMHAKLHFAALCLASVLCKQFQEQHSELLAKAGTDSQNGHDLWLTRNRHGSGYFDRGYPDEIGDALTAASHALGECDLYEGDDGQLYFSR